MTDRMTKKGSKDPKQPKQKNHFPITLALLLALLLYVMSRDPLLSIAIPLGIWIIVKVRG